MFEKSLNFNLLLSNNKKLPTNLNLISPSSGDLTFNDFPVSVQMASTNPEQITKINLVLEKNNGEKIILKTISEVLNKTTTLVWSERPENGPYKLFAEFFDWNGNSKESNKIRVNIK